MNYSNALALYTMLILSLSLSVRGSDVATLKDLRLSMPSSDFRSAYPDGRMLFAKMDTNRILLQGVVLCDILASDVWDTAIVHVEGGEVEGWSYVRTRAPTNELLIVRRVYNELVREHGTPAQERVALHDVKDRKVRSAGFVWLLDDAWILFTHTPLTNGATLSTRLCQVSYGKLSRPVQSVFAFASDKENGDAALFAQATGQVKRDSAK